MPQSTAKSVAALIALSLSTFTYVTTETLPIGLLRPIADGLDSSASAVGMLVTVYGLVVVVASIPLTYVTGRLPRRALMTGLLAVFTVATAVSAVAPHYSVMMGARVVTALTHALFWSIVVPTAASLFSIQVRGRVLGIVMAGSSLAAVLGVPAGTWLGQQAGWRSSFLALSVIAVVAMLGTARLLPGGPAPRGSAARGETPDLGRYALLMVTTVLAITGAFTAFTFITVFLVDAAGFAEEALSPLLLIRGLAGVVGVLAGGWLVDRSPLAAMAASAALQAVAWLGLYAVDDSPVLTAVLIGASGMSFSALLTALGSRILQVAPGRKDIAAAGASTAVNLGITVGAFVGGLLLPAFGVASTVLVGGLLSVAALATALCEPLLRRRREADQQATPPADPVLEHRAGR